MGGSGNDVSSEEERPASGSSEGSLRHNLMKSFPRIDMFNFLLGLNRISDLTGYRISFFSFFLFFLLDTVSDIITIRPNGVIFFREITKTKIVLLRWLVMMLHLMFS